MENICGVKFKDFGKVYYFKNNGLNLKKDLTVVVDTEKGEQFAKVSETNVLNRKNIDLDTMKNVLRISTKEDYNKYMKNLKDAASALNFSRKLVRDMNLEMRLLDATFTLDKKQLTINFIADSRIDFRILVKEIAAKYKTRIELHQLGVRDKSKEIGGLGQCGRELCCAKFLNGIDTISINMAKNQNIALNPSKINGACGRLLCCLSYEDDVYTEHRSYLPKLGETVTTKDGSGKVVTLDVLNKKYTVLIDGDKKEYELD
ncbi:MAG: regulatory iron-sulfur-containing complex subunit RicT [Bacilli bacterium]|nr:regulatory iron-sulfur-containing complex subunit RicT [Bacilli bacterium]